jgi:alpha-L-fucosidase 2
LLPALPEGWREGSVRGLRARDAFEVNVEWAEGRLTKAVIRSDLGRPCRVRYGDRTVDLETETGGEYVLDGDLKRMR